MGKLLLVKPATNAVGERSFSALRRRKTYLSSNVHKDGTKDVARGGPGVPVSPPFWKPFLTKQPRTGGENAMTFKLENVQTNEYPHFDTV